MIISFIAAVSDNNVIGKDGKLPWNLPDDLQHFHDLTVGCPVIMGRKTYESIPEKYRPLSDRANIILTRQGLEIPGCIVVRSMEEALEKIRNTKHHPPPFGLWPAGAMRNNEEIFIVGGAEVYRQALPLAQRIYLTRVHTAIEGDVFFPDVPWEEWQEVSREEHVADVRHAWPWTFLTYERK